MTSTNRFIKVQQTFSMINNTDDLCKLQPNKQQFAYFLFMKDTYYKGYYYYIICPASHIMVYLVDKDNNRLWNISLQALVSSDTV